MIDATYHQVRIGPRLSRTIQVNETTLVDVDLDGRVIGIETLGQHGHVDWLAILADDRFRFVRGNQS